MPIDPQMIPHLQEALGAGFESIIASLNGTPAPAVTGGKKKSPTRRRRVRGGAAASQDVAIAGGRSRRRTRASPRRSKARSLRRSKRIAMRRSRSRLMNGKSIKRIARSLSRVLLPSVNRRSLSRRKY
jgi:hypothetical protein